MANIILNDNIESYGTEDISSNFRFMGYKSDNALLNNLTLVY